MAIKFVKQLFFATNSLVTKFTNYFNRNHKVLQQKTLVCNNTKSGQTTVCSLATKIISYFNKEKNRLQQNQYMFTERM
jgi:hypothetical protein